MIITKSLQGVILSRRKTLLSDAHWAEIDRDTRNSYTWLQINNTGEGKQDISGQGISCASYFTENKGVNRGVNWMLRYPTHSCASQMLAFKLIFSRQKIEIVFSEDSKLKYTNSGVQNKQTEMSHQITPSKTHGWQSQSRQRASIYFTFFSRLTSWCPVLECGQSI